MVELEAEVESSFGSFILAEPEVATSESDSGPSD